MRRLRTKVRGGGVVFLTNNRNTLPLYDWLGQQEQHVSIFSDKLQMDQLWRGKPEWIVSYNYNHLISKEVIQQMPGRIINLHISFLPWNKGMHPNFWSFWEDTPKGVTIHYINEGLDTGDIIAQQEVIFDLKDKKLSLSSTYKTLNVQIQKLFMEHWDCIQYGTCSRLQQAASVGSFHFAKDLFPIWKQIENYGGWDINIQDLFMLKESWDENIADIKKKLMTSNNT